MPKGTKHSIIDNTWKVRVGGCKGSERRLDKDGIKKESPGGGGRQGTHFVFKEM